MKLLVLVFVIGLASLKTQVRADPKVNLIFPSIIGAQPVTRTIEYNNYTLFIYTRAAQYKLVNFDLLKGTRGHIERVGEWQKPDLINQDLFEYENKIPRSNRLSRIQGLLATFPKGLKYMVEPAAALHNCEVLIKIGGNDICSRKSHLIMMAKNTIYVMGSLYLDYSTYTAPITAAYGTPRSTVNNDYFMFDVIAFDSTGRVFVSQFTHRGNTLTNTVIGSIDLSSILSPLANRDPKNNKPWSDSSYLMKDKIKLKDRILNNAETKQMGCYVESIAPMYQKVDPVFQGFSDDFSPLYYESSGQNESVVPIETLLQGSKMSQNQIAFCLSRGFRMFEDRSTGSNIQCAVNGQSLNNYVDPIGISNSWSKFTPLALQLTSDDRFRYIHLVYSLVDYNTTNYMFCMRPGQIEAGKEQSEPIYVDWPENQLVQGCYRTIINNPPDDIVFLQQNKCSLHAALYGPVYTLSRVNASLLEQLEEPQLLKEITFQVNAAFAMNGNIYFFTGSNRIISIEYQIADGCRSISLKKDTLKDFSSEEYIYENFLKFYGPLGEPSFIDYREFEEGAQNTKPALEIGSDPPPTLPSPGPVPAPPKSSNSNSKLITIAVGIIIGGLIIAAVIYFLCLRGRDEEAAVKMQSRKSRRSPSASPMSDLMVKTVRSKFQSSTGVGPVVAAKSHKSRAMSPKSKSAKSVKKPPPSQISKSFKGSNSFKSSNSPKSPKVQSTKSSKSSKLNVKSNKTITRSPLSA